MKKIIPLLLFGIFLITVVSAFPNNLSLNLQVESGGVILPGTYTFNFSITNNSDCLTDTVYSYQISKTTDARAIVNLTLPDVNVNFDDSTYRLCYRRNGILKSRNLIGSSPYAFFARNTTLSGLIPDSNLNMSPYNLTTGYVNVSGDLSVLRNSSFDGDLNPITTLTWDIGSGARRWNYLYVSNISADFLDATQGITTLGNVSAEYFNGSGAYLTSLNISGDLTGYDLNVSFIYGHAGIGGLDVRGDPWWFSGADFRIQNNLTVDANVSADWFNGKFNWGTNDTMLDFDGSTLGLDREDFNSSVRELFAVTYYNSTEVTLEEATESGGALSDTYIYDGTSYNITETAGAPGLDIRFNFTNVEDFNEIIIRMKMDGRDHEVNIQLWDDILGDWENYATIIEIEEYQVIELGVYDSTDHINGEDKVQLRFYMSVAGNTNHEFFFDWIQIADEPATFSTQEIDPLSYHRGTNLNFSDYNLTDIDYMEIRTLNVTETSYLADLIITADNITVNNLNSKDGNITINNATGGEIARFTGDGRVGIGTQIPTQGSSFGTADAMLEIEGSSNPNLVIHDTGQANEYYLYATSDDFGINYGTTIMLAIQNDGNIGIGTASPLTQFHIKDNPSPVIRLDNTQVALSQGQSLGGLEFYNPDNSGAGIGAFIYANISEADGTGGYLTFGTGDGDASEQMRINASGGIGIGTASPTHTVDVVGNLNATLNISTDSYFIGNGSFLTDVPAYNGSYLTNNSVVNFTEVMISSFVNVSGYGVFSGPTFPVLTSEKTTTDTNLVQSVMRYKARTSGNMADGFGPAFRFTIEDDTSGSQDVAYLMVTRDAADNSGKFRFRTYDGGSSNEGLIIRADGSIETDDVQWHHTTLDADGGANVDVSELHVRLRNKADDNNEAIGIGFGISSNSANVGAAIIHQRDGSQSYGGLHFATKPTGAGAGADIPKRMTIIDTGEVGIGTTAPTHNLNVVGDVNITESLEAECVEPKVADRVFEWHENEAPVVTNGFQAMSGTVSNTLWIGRYVPYNITIIDFNILSTDLDGFDCDEQFPFIFYLQNGTDGVNTNISAVNMDDVYFNQTQGINASINEGDHLRIYGYRGSEDACDVGEGAGVDVVFQVTYKRRCD